MRHQVTIKDIAKQLNVSVATVSRALRDLPDIHPDTKKAVLDLAAELDYQPNVLATSLVKSKTNSSGSAKFHVPLGERYAIDVDDFNNFEIMNPEEQDT